MWMNEEMLDERLISPAGGGLGFGGFEEKGGIEKSRRNSGASID